MFATVMLVHLMTDIHKASWTAVFVNASEFYYLHIARWNVCITGVVILNSAEAKKPEQSQPIRGTPKHPMDVYDYYMPS